MESNNDFAYDLQFGNIQEDNLAKMLNHKRIEVKSDRLHEKTGNIYVEYMSRGKPSGIATTFAEYYAFMLSETEVHIMKTSVVAQRIKDWIKECNEYGAPPHKTYKVRGGDEKTSIGVLIPKWKLFSV